MSDENKDGVSTAIDNFLKCVRACKTDEEISKLAEVSLTVSNGLLRSTDGDAYTEAFLISLIEDKYKITKIREH